MISDILPMQFRIADTFTDSLARLTGYESKTVLRDGEIAPAPFPDALVQVEGLVN